MDNLMKVRALFGGSEKLHAAIVARMKVNGFNFGKFTDAQFKRSATRALEELNQEALARVMKRDGF